MATPALSLLKGPTTRLLRQVIMSCTAASIGLSLSPSPNAIASGWPEATMTFRYVCILGRHDEIEKRGLAERAPTPFSPVAGVVVDGSVQEFAGRDPEDVLRLFKVRIKTDGKEAVTEGCMTRHDGPFPEDLTDSFEDVLLATDPVVDGTHDQYGQYAVYTISNDDKASPLFVGHGESYENAPTVLMVIRTSAFSTYDEEEDMKLVKLFLEENRP